MKGFTRYMVRNVCKARGGDNDCLMCNLCNDHSVSVKGTKFLGKNQCLLPYPYLLCSAKFVKSFFWILIVFVKLISLLKTFLIKVSVRILFLALQNEVKASTGTFKIQIWSPGRRNYFMPDMKRENQQDARIRCLLLISVSTCFGHHYVHLQENKDPARILQRSAPQPLPTTSSRTRTTHQMQ